jgi:starch-binding outer membrane protein, SusD/RagB family
MQSLSIRAAGRFALLLLSPALAALPGCTDLSETPESATTPEQFFRTDQEVLGGLAAVYVQLRNMLPGSADGNWYNVTQVSSDEMIVPTRGSDWFDNGRWLEIDRQTWTPTSTTAGDMNGIWVTAFTGITRANVMLQALEGVTVAKEDTIVAELRTLRAFYYYTLMDMFGGVPIVTTPEIKERPRNARAEVFQFIADELHAARADLPDRWPDASHGRLTKGAADAILANMYLNAGVFARDAGVSATAYNSCMIVQIGAATACDSAIAAADRILNSPLLYSLADSFHHNFRHDNHTSPENIMVAKHINRDGQGFRLLMTSLHYNQFTPAPWNGFATIADVYNAFDPADRRRGIFLEGLQRNLETGEIVCERPGCDRGGAQLVFTPSIADPTQASEGEGVRIAKWPHDPNHVGPDNGNDYPFFRVAEMVLIRAEALNEQSPGSGAALALLNQLRARPAETVAPALVGPIDRDMILRERLFELTAEAKRRQDLIRHGRFIQVWEHKDVEALPRAILMPIPQAQLDANPMLTQNPGY